MSYFRKPSSIRCAVIAARKDPISATSPDMKTEVRLEDRDGRQAVTRAIFEPRGQNDRDGRVFECVPPQHNADDVRCNGKNVRLRKKRRRSRRKAMRIALKSFYRRRRYYFHRVASQPGPRRHTPRETRDERPKTAWGRNET